MGNLFSLGARMTRASTRLLLLAAVAAAPVNADSVPSPDVLSFSGSPLLLEFTLPDPDGSLVSASIRTQMSSLDFAFEPEPGRESVRLAATPLLRPVTADLSLVCCYADATERRTDLRIGYVDFVFGRDNLRFGNNESYRSSIGTFGMILRDWIDDRFGGVTDTELVLLVDYMYGLFGANTGRCYAFSGSEVRYWLWPDLLPTYYHGAYNIRANVPRYEREMNFLQLDMAYERFVARGGTGMHGAMDRDAVAAEVDAIKAQIDAGKLVAVGFAGPNLHHSMAVFGYIERPGEQRIDLLVANNWKDGEDLNLHSRDAEMIRIGFAPQGSAEGDAETPAPTFEWRYDGGTRGRKIDRLFVVDVRRDGYDHDPDDLAALTAMLTRRFRENGRAIVVVEDAADAWLTDGEHYVGRKDGRTREDIDGVFYDRASRSFRFAWPTDLPLELFIADDTGAQVLSLVPDALSGEATARITTTEKPPNGQRVTRAIPLRDKTSARATLATDPLY